MEKLEKVESANQKSNPTLQKNDTRQKNSQPENKDAKVGEEGQNAKTPKYEVNLNMKGLIEAQKIKSQLEASIKLERERRDNYGLAEGKKIAIEVKIEAKKESEASRLPRYYDQGRKISANAQDSLTIGFSEKLFKQLKDPSYVTNILKLPQMSFLFNELDFSKAIKENQKNIKLLKKSKEKKKFLIKKSYHPLKPKKGEISLTITARLRPYDGRNKIVSSEMIYKQMNDIQLGGKEIEVARVKLAKMPEDKRKTHIDSKIHQSWKNMSKSISNYRKFFIRTDMDQNAKKLAFMTAKFWRKKFKKKGSSNDIFLRLKKMSKEIKAYLKRRTRDLQDMKKKRERIEADIRKQEQEKREELK